jgi:Xaa-Pro dipeptidase
MLDPQSSRRRQARLCERMIKLGLDAVVVAATEHVYYLSAYRPFWLHQAAVILFSDGRTIGILPIGASPSATVEKRIEFEANWMGTQRLDQPAAVAELAVDQLKSRHIARLGLDASAVSSQILLRWSAESAAIDPVLWQMRRTKDADELVLMRKAFQCIDAMYARAREIVRPGVDEIALFADLNTVALTTAGEPLSAHLGNDYSSGAPGGPPRGGKTARAGEIFILDLGPAYRGYFSDASRAFAVGGKPTDEQLRTHAVLCACFPLIERRARPGVRCRDLFAAVDEYLQSSLGVGLTHHLGHGVGLFPHEFPHLNPRWDEVLLEGDVFTCEPGIYSPTLNAGLRLENTYLLKTDGVENLVATPMDLA